MSRSAARLFVALLTGLLALSVPGPETPAQADGPQDNLADQVRRIPKLGIEVPPAEQEQIETHLAELAQRLEELRAAAADKQTPHRQLIQRYLPDVEVFYWAPYCALTYQEFFQPAEIPAAVQQLEMGLERAEELAAGRTPWLQQSGAVIRGYRSRIDHSVQPYAVYVPRSYQATGTDRYRCDLWFHGRGETLSEVSFIRQRLAGQGAVSSDRHFMVHPYGRYSNANKFAGEIDTFEVLEHLQQDYRIDEDRIAARGFSMGGAACWQFAVHYADRWFAATPGAGFSETPEFLRTFQKETLTPTPYERKLWHLYDCTDYAINLYHCPTIAYSGEIDTQKQAADIMEEALQREGIDMVHIIGPDTAHRIHPDSLREIEERLTSLEALGRDRTPREIHFTTYTLRYNRMHWVTVDALREHWERARVDATVTGSSSVELTTQNVDALTLEMPAGHAAFDLRRPVQVSIDGQIFDGPRPQSDRSWRCQLHRRGDVWFLGAAETEGLKKRHGLQGPIDDAFMDSFIFVEPGGQAAHPQVETWVRGEFEHAVEHWRRHFRGHPRVKQDAEITDEDIASSNLVLFGDPKSNAVLARLADRLPIRWEGDAVVVGETRYPAATHGLVLVAPNPLNPQRYVVLNSGFTFREYDYLNNARQVPKLPDWAVVDVTVPPNSRYPGKIAAADFFDESWSLKAPSGR